MGRVSKVKATLVSTINPTSILVNVTGKQGIKVKKFMANEIVTATEPFVPFRDGYLKNSATIALDGNFIQYNMPYARRLWYGDGFNFNGAPIRGSRWVERSWAVNGNEILLATARYIARGN